MNIDALLFCTVDFLEIIYISRCMDTLEAIRIFDTLSQETRLNAFRQLVKSGESGIAAGKLSEKLNVPQNTLSFHLSHLSNAGVVSARKVGRSIIYTANFEVVHGLIEFMVKDCCSEDSVNIRDDNRKGCSIIELTKCC